MAVSITRPRAGVAVGPLRIHPMVLFGLFLLVFPYLVVYAGKRPFNATEFLVWALFAMGFNLLWGFAGDLSFGHGMFFGWGAYTTGILSRELATSPASILIALAGGAAAAMVVSWPLAKLIVRRSHGVYFAMITLAIGQVFFFLSIRLTSITGGANGLGGISRGSVLGLNMLDEVFFYYFTAVVVFLVAWLLWTVTGSPFGWVCRGVQQNLNRMAFLGFDPVRYRERAFVYSAGICGVAGGLSAFLFLHVAPDTLHWTTTGEAVVMTMLGGVGSFFGPAAGAIFYKFLESILNPITDYWPAFLGGVFVVFVLVAPQGLVGLARRAWSSSFGRRSGAP